MNPITEEAPSKASTCLNCEHTIFKGQRRLHFRYKGKYGPGNIFLCSICIQKAYKELDMKKERMLICSKVV